MPRPANSIKKPIDVPAIRTFDATQTIANGSALPLGALLLAGSIGALAQPLAPAEGRTLDTVTVKEKAVAPEGKDALRTTSSGIAKGNQLLRDIPQSVTVVTEKLIDDRNLDTLKEALKNTAGITFLAAEGGEEDIRLRGFPLQGTGDVFVDGLRDPAFYDRDTFNLDRVELLRGSASMLFGRGSTGGAVNMVNKVARPMDEHQVDVTLGSHRYRRVVGDFNLHTGEDAALRINAMSTTADNNGSGSRLEKKGIAATYRWGIGQRDEFSVSLYHLDNRNGMNYGLPWIRPTATAVAAQTTILPVAPTAYYGMASDLNAGQATYGTLTHLHRFDQGGELRTQLRRGAYARDQRASTIRLAAAAAQPGGVAASLASFGPATVLTRGTQLKIQDLDSTYAQSDFSASFQAWGMKHQIQTGVDIALEKKGVYGALSAAQGGMTPAKPNTSAGQPDDGAWVDESSRLLRPTSRYTSTGWGLYFQDLVQVTPHWKVLAGLRYDRLRGDYDTFAIPSNASGPVTTARYTMRVSEVSKRLGVLFQPDELQSYHVSLANSFNTSGDAYSLSASNASTPPEQAINFEIGARIDSADRRFTTRLAAFRSTKLHERNTDPLVNLTTLSGRRHVAGAEIDVTGRLNPRWEVYGSYMWLPIATIDTPVTGGETGRPSLTPRHSGTLWTTYQFAPRWRAGAGLNVRGRQTPNRNPGWEVPGFATADLMAEYVISQLITLKANLTNVTDKRYADQLYSGHYVPGAGRMFQLTASFKF